MAFYDKNSTVSVLAIYLEFNGKIDNGNCEENGSFYCLFHENWGRPDLRNT